MSTGDAAIAARHKTAGFPIETRKVPSLPLSDILSRFGTKDIHWLKIDVEGMERSVIDSWLPSEARPWVVIVESTEPNSSIPNFESWEPPLLRLGYDFVYFDGLNRFYVSAKQPQLKAAFGPGANLFDGFSLTTRSIFTRLQAAEQSALQQNLVELRQDLSKSRDDFDQQEQRAEQLQLAIGSRDSTIRSRDLSIGDLNSRFAAQGKQFEEAQLTIAARDVSVADLASRLTAQEKLVAEGRLVIADLNIKFASQQRISGQAQGDVERLRLAVEDLRSRNDALLGSTSWRLTKPMRDAKIASAHIRQGIWAWITFAPRSRPRRVARRIVAELAI